MAIVGVNRGTGGNATASTTISIVPPSNFQAGSLAVLALAYDNSGGAGADPYSSITDNAGNTWVSRTNGLNDPGAASAGCALRIFTADVVSLGTSNTITVTFGSSTTAKSWTLTQLTSDLPNYVARFIEAKTPATGSGTTPTLVVATPIPRAIFCAMGNEGNATVTADSDIINGNWSTQQTISNGTGTSGIQVASQYKDVISDGTQTYNLTLSASGDWVACAIRLVENLNFTPSDPFGMMGFFGL